MILAGDIGGTKTILALYDAIPEARASLREATGGRLAQAASAVPHRAARR